MSSGRTYWLALDARWLAREGVVEAREEAGHAAVTVLLALMGQAKLENDGGRVITGYRALAREAFLANADEAKAVVTVCHASGLLDDLEEHEDGKRFSCRISGWQSDQAKGRAADRKASSRTNENDDPEPNPDDESRLVTPGHAPVGTGQERTGEKKSTPQPPASGGSDHPGGGLRANGTNPRALAEAAAALEPGGESWCAAHFPSESPSKVQAAMQQVRRTRFNGGEPTVENLIAYGEAVSTWRLVPSNVVELKGAA